MTGYADGCKIEFVLCLFVSPSTGSFLISDGTVHAKDPEENECPSADALISRVKILINTIDVARYICEIASQKL